MTLEEAQKLLESVLDNEAKGTYPYEYQVIQKQVKHIKPHAVDNYVPEHLLEERAPNATEEQIKYIKKNWKCTTQQVFHELLNVIQRGFIDDNWQIIWSDEQSDMQAYCEDDFPVYGSTERIIKEIVPPMKYLDANALMAVRPMGFSFLVDEGGEYLQDAEGNFVVDDTQMLEPCVYFHPSKDVLIRELDYYLVASNEKSVVEYNGKSVQDGRVMYLYTKNEIYKIEQYGKKIDNTYQVYLYYQHDEGVIPAIELGGVPQIIENGKVIQKSPFRFATDLLDLALTNKNYLQISVNNVVFPFRIMMADPCTFATEEGRCEGGKWISNETGLHTGTCSHCKGTGQNTPYSPLGVYLWQKPEGMEQSNIPFKPVEFVEAPTQGLEFIQGLVDRDTENAKEILHLTKSTAQKSKDAVTATETAYNDNGQISFVRYNVHQLFDLWLWMLKRISWQRYDNYDNVPELVYPRTFDFRSEQDIWNQIQTARESEAPVSIIHDLFKALVNNLYASSPSRQKVFETITQADKLFALSDVDIAARKAANSVEAWQVNLHDSSIQLIGQLIREDENYLELELQDRIDKLVELAKSSTFVSNTNVVQDILNRTQGQ